MKDAGFTHSVTLMDNYSVDTNNNPGIKIFDRHIEWSEITSLPIGGSNLPGKYIFSQGQEEDNYSFEIGDLSSITLNSLTKGENFGFGPNRRAQSSVWFMNTNSDFIPSWVNGNISGSIITDDDGNEEKLFVARRPVIPAEAIIWFTV
jgi:hypothetical protein